MEVVDGTVDELRKELHGEVQVGYSGCGDLKTLLNPSLARSLSSDLCLAKTVIWSAYFCIVSLIIVFVVTVSLRVIALTQFRLLPVMPFQYSAAKRSLSWMKMKTYVDEEDVAIGKPVVSIKHL